MAPWLFTPAGSTRPPTGYAYDGNYGYGLEMIRVEEFLPSTPIAPLITGQPVDVDSFAGASASFTVAATGGTLPLFYQWYKVDGTNFAWIDKATNATYAIPAVGVADVASYAVVVTNSLGSVTSRVAVLAFYTNAPVITADPQDATLLSGATASLTVTATGQKIQYQWYAGDLTIANATNATLTLTNVTTAQAGYYQARVSNPNGASWSRSALVSISRPSVLVFDTNQVWSYVDTGVNLGTNWYNVTNSAALSWPKGPGLVGFKYDGNGVLLSNDTAVPDGYRYFRTFLSRTGASGATNATYYLRGGFNMDTALLAPGANFTLNCLIDDGAIIYLNGVQLFRYGMPATVDYTTWAGTSTNASSWVRVPVPADSIRPGTNVIAVEVHQINTTSSDLDWLATLELNYAPPTPLVITNQPQSAIVPAGPPATFTVGVGTAAAFMWAEYQWYKVVDGAAVAIPGANQSTLVLSNVQVLADSGTYFVAATNPVSSVYSKMVTLTVVTDTNPPVLVEADGSYNASSAAQINPTNVYVTFSEPVTLQTATNPANYSVREASGATITVTQAVMFSISNVMLKTSSARKSTANYSLVVNNIKDVSPSANTIAANSEVPITRMVNLINWSMDAANLGKAELYDAYITSGVPGFGGDMDVGLDWATNHAWAPASDWYTDQPTAFGQFNRTANYDGINPNLSQFNSLVNQGPFYLRRWFTNNATGSGMTIRLSHFVDDGVIIFVNNTEVARYNAGEGASGLSIWTPAPTDIDADNVRQIDVVVPNSVLVPGGNYIGICVKPHDFYTDLPDFQPGYYNDVDVFFDMAIQVRSHGFVGYPARICQNPLSKTVVEGQPVTFGVGSYGGATFQWKRNGANIEGATNGTYTIDRVPSSLSGSGYSVAITGLSNQTLLSTSGTLTVLPDTNGPSLVSAFASMTQPQITVAFSEWLDLASAQTIANYTVTNSSGGASSNLVVTSATLNSQSNVVLNVAAYIPGEWFVVVNNVKDSSAAGNKIASNSVVSVGVNSTSILSIQNTNFVWRYNQQGVQPETNWTALAYDDSAWTTGLAAFDSKYDTATGVYTERNTVSGVSIRTHTLMLAPDGVTHLSAVYYRGKFQLLAPLAGATVSVQHFLDDGGVFYLNGQEVGRYGMPVGAVAYATAANVTVGDAALLGPVVGAAPQLGFTNMFAAEVHQVNLTSSDISFGVNVSVSKDSKAYQIGEADPTTVVTLPATNITTTNAYFNGSVNPRGFAPTKVWAEYGTNNTFNNVVVIGRSYTGLNTTNLTVSVSGLLAGYSYSYRLVASNNYGVVRADAVTFATQAPQSPPPPVLTGTPTLVKFTTAQLNGRMSPTVPTAVTLFFEYSTGGVTNTSAAISTNFAIGPNQTFAIAVSNLLPATTYSVRAFATNSGGRTNGGFATLNTYAVRPTMLLTTNGQGRVGGRFTGLTGAPYGVFTNSVVTAPLSKWGFLTNAVEISTGAFGWTDPKGTTNSARLFYQLRGM